MYKNSRFGQLLGLAVPRDLLNQIDNRGRPKCKARDIDVGDSSYRFSLSVRARLLSLFRIFNPLGGSIILELLPQRLGNNFPSIRFHQLESQLYRSDTLLTKHDVV
jgi:hypothetical protein